MNNILIKTTELFIKDAIEIHGHKYDYSKVKYINNKKRIEIICKKHGTFYQIPNNHLSKKMGCAICGGKKIDTGKYISTFKEKYGDKFIYASFTKSSDILTLECKIHGLFKISAKQHLNHECKKCEEDNKLNRLKSIHGDVYQYVDLPPVIKMNTILNIICQNHDIFKQSYHSHLNSGCPKCAIENSRLSLDDFINRSTIKHNSRYDYSLVEYITTLTKVKIICQTHGIFLQCPHSHLKGSGCQICKSSKGEIVITDFLNRNRIKFNHQYKFKNCRNINSLSFDFYLPNHNLCIEYDGILHYKCIEHFGGKEYFDLIQKRDTIKTNYCRENNIRLIRIPYWEYDKIENILSVNFKQLFSPEIFTQIILKKY